MPMLHGPCVDFCNASMAPKLGLKTFEKKNFFVLKCSKYGATVKSKISSERLSHFISVRNLGFFLDLRNS